MACSANLDVLRWSGKRGRGAEGLTANASEVGAYLCGLLEEFAHRLVASFAPASSRVITVGAVHLSGTELLSAALIGGYRLTRQFVTQGGESGSR